MKNLYKKIAPTLFLAVFSVFLLAGYATSKEAGSPASANIKEERLVVKDLGGGLPFHITGWCGSTGLLINSDKSGKEWVGLNGDSFNLTTKGIDRITGCSPDGKWVIYEENGSSRVYKDKWGRTPEHPGGDGPGWHGYIFDLSRYEIATGKQEKFAVVRDDSKALVSPDGTKVLLGNKHDSALKPVKKRWKAVWLTNKWVYGSTRWFADSSGIATLIWGNGYSLGIETFNKENSRAKEYDFGVLGFGPEPNRSIHFGAVDKDNRLYFTVINSGEDYATSKFRFFRCEIKDREISCELTGEFNEGGRNINSHEMLPGGDLIFSRDGDRCIRRLKPGRPDAECIADTYDGSRTYNDIYLIGASPDGRLIAFRRGKKSTKPSDRFYGYQYDLFVKELSKD